MFLPPAKIPTARARGRRLRLLGLVVSSERLRATLRPRSGGLRATWTVEGRADRSSAPAGSCLSAMGGAVAQGTCAARAARAHPWRRASTTRDGPAPQARTTLHRPADASRAAPIAGGEVKLALLCGEGTLSTQLTTARTAADNRGRRRIIREDVCSSRSAPPASARAARGPEIDVAARSSAGPAVCAEGAGRAVDPTPGQNCNQ